MVFSDRLKTLREQERYSQSQFAKLIDVRPNTVWRWENGKAKPDAERIVQIASALNTTSAYLLGESEDARPVRPADKAEPVQTEINFEPVDKDDTARKTSIDKGTLVYTFGDKKLEVPNTPETAPLFWAIVHQALQPQATAAV